MNSDNHERGLHVIGASKRFGATVALHDVNLRVTTGEVRALMGANGSGKSTLIKALAGYHSLDQGQILVNGEELRLSHLGDDAKAAGLRFVHQDLALIPTLSVAENLGLERGFPRGRSGAIDRKVLNQWATERMHSVGVDIDPTSKIERLGPVEKTLVAITRALDDVDPAKNIILLDEPTARLPAHDTDRLIRSLERLQVLGLPIVYVTHRIDEVYRMAETITVLRDGFEVHEGSLEGLPPDQLKILLIGERDIGPGEQGSMSSSPTESDDGMVLDLRHVAASHLMDINLQIAGGEIVAITGLIGSGRSELGRVIYGLQEYVSGTIEFDGSDVGSPKSNLRISNEVGYTPQDRISGLLEGLSVSDNVAVTRLDSMLAWYGLSRKAMKAAADEVVSALGVVTPGVDAQVDWLSGGNQQKVVLGKWIRLDLRLLILDEPTQSIDIGAKAELMTAIRAKAKSAGLAVLWLESDVQEIVKYADRILVMSDGRIGDSFSAPFDRVEVLSSVYGETAGEVA